MALTLYECLWMQSFATLCTNWCLLPDKLPANNKLFISRFTSREEAAVAEWLSSSLPFHTMRDHPDHQVEIMGGMWGARMDLGHRDLFKNLTQVFIDDVSRPPWLRLRNFLLISTVGSSHYQNNPDIQKTVAS